VLTTMHEAHEFRQYPNILLFTHDYTHPGLQQILIKN